MNLSHQSSLSFSSVFSQFLSCLIRLVVQIYHQRLAECFLEYHFLLLSTQTMRPHLNRASHFLVPFHTVWCGHCDEWCHEFGHSPRDTAKKLPNSESSWSAKTRNRLSGPYSTWFRISNCSNRSVSGEKALISILVETWREIRQFDHGLPAVELPSSPQSFIFSIRIVSREVPLFPTKWGLSQQTFTSWNAEYASMGTVRSSEV